MKKGKAESNQNGNLRRHAEERLKSRQSSPVGSKTADGVDAMALVHELQLHQIELEMQNEELKRAKLEMEDALTKYSDLYDFAPIGLFAIDSQGRIKEVNLAGAELLSIERRSLMNNRFRLFVAPKDRPCFDDFCKSAFETSFKQTCELNLLKDGKPVVYARIEGLVAEESSPKGRQCRIAVVDITEGKNAEEKLAQQIAVQKTVIESSEGPIFSVDRKYRYTSFNSQHAEVMKALFGANIEVGHSILDYHTDFNNRISAQTNIDRALSGESLTLEACAGDKALSRHYFEISHNPVRDSHGEITGVAVYARDLTEYKRTKKALLKSEEKCHLLINNANEPIIVVQDGLLKFVNHAAFGMWGGFSERELIDRPIPEFIHPDDRGMVVENYLRRMAKEASPPRYSFRVVTREGIVKWVEINVVLIEWQGKPATLNFLTDITSRKQAEEALRESEEKWRSLVSALPDYILLLDREGRILFLNHYAEGFTEKEIIGCSVYKFFSMQSGELIKKEIAECQKTGRIRKFEHTAVGDHGIMRVYESYLVPLLEKNNVTGFLGISRDITGRKRDEEALQRYSENLKDLVEERTKQLQQATHLAALGEMATMVGHDLRNPLQVVISMVYLAKEMLTSAQTPQVDGHITATEILDDIEKSCSYMNQIISDLQSYAGPLNLELAKTDIHQLICNAISFLEIPDGVEVSVEVEDGLPEITIDPEKIKRVIINLVNNSIQSMSKGGHIAITAIRKGDSVVLTIRDEGAGIPNEYIPKLFLPLFTTKSKGIGLGLTICKRLVEAHRGNIDVTSKANAGTEVTIKIPQDEETWTRNLY